LQSGLKDSRQTEVWRPLPVSLIPISSAVIFTWVISDISLNVSDSGFILGDRATPGMMRTVILQLTPRLGQIPFFTTKICSAFPVMISLVPVPIVLSHDWDG